MAGEEVTQFNENEVNSWFRPSCWLPRWTPTSMQALEKAERKILSGLWSLIENRFVPIKNGNGQLRTVILNKESTHTPLVMVHGMGSGVGLWVLNLPSLAAHRPVYAFDVLGFGRSSRPRFSKDAMLTEMEMVESIEDWRKEVGLDKFIMMGHSLGGFIAAAYAIRFPQHIRHLVLADPWGFPDIPKEANGAPSSMPAWVKIIATMISPFNPLAGLRAAGPWGPRIVSKLRPDLVRKFSDLFDDDTVPDYIFHCNAQTPSGETAFKHLTQNFGWAKHPMVGRIGEIPNNVPITMLFGSRSWIDSSVGYQIKYIRNESYVDVQIIKGSGHHVYADKAEAFNAVLNKVGAIVDEQIDLLGRTPSIAYRRLRRLSEGGGGSLAAASKGMKRRTVSECALNSIDHTEEVQAAAMGTSYSMGIIEDEKEDMITEGDMERLEEQTEQEEEEGDEAVAKFSLGHDSDEESKSTSRDQ